MPRFFVPPESIVDNTVTLNGADAKHLIRVLRCEVGQELILSDNQGNDYDVIIRRIDREADSVETSVISRKENETENNISITLFQGIPKADKMDFIIMKSTELGVNKIVPVDTKYCVAKIPPQKIQAKTQRFQKIADEAAKQCQRGKIPKVSAPVSYHGALEMVSSFDLVLIAYELETVNHLRNVINQHQAAKKIALFVGPEGGFAEEEVFEAVEKGAVSITLGKRILRTETAGISLISMLLYAFDQI